MNIFAVKIESLESTGTYVELLNEERKYKVLSCRKEEAKMQSLYAGLLLRFVYLNKGYTQEDWLKERIQYNQFRKPFIKDINFSISHSGEWVVIAQSDAEPVGIDIEQLKTKDFDRLAKRFFCENEYNCVIKKAQTDKMYEFYRIWTAMESYGKCTGKGLSDSLNKINITRENEVEVDGNKVARVKYYEDIEEYMVCVCNEKDIQPKGISILRLKDLL